MTPFNGTRSAIVFVCRYGWILIRRDVATYGRFRELPSLENLASTPRRAGRGDGRVAADDALGVAMTSMFWSPYLYLYAFGSFSNGLFISLRGPVIPELARRVGRDPAALGTYLGLCGVAGGAFAVPTGALLDRYDPHVVFASGVLLRAVSVGATPLCARLWQVNLLAVAQGVTLPLIGVSIRVCLVRAVGKDRCAAALNFTMGAFGLASILAPVAYAALVRAFPARGFDLVFLLAALVYLALAAVVPFFPAPPPDEDEAQRPPPPPATADDDRSEPARPGDAAREAGVIVSDRPPARRRLDLDRAATPAEAEDPGTPPRDTNRRTGSSKPRRRSEDADADAGTVARGSETTTVRSAAAPSGSDSLATLAALTAYVSLSVATEVTFGSWIYTLAMDRGAFDANAAATLTSGFWCAFTAARFILAFLDASPLTAILASHALAGATLSWLGGYWRGWWDASGLVAGLSPAATLWVTTLAVGAGTAGMFPNGIALGRRMFPLDGFAQATFELGAATGAGVGPFVAAAAYRRTKDPATIPMTCVAAGIGALAALAVALAANAREKRRREGGAVAEAEEDEEIAALVRPLLDAREEGDSNDRRNDRRTPSSVV